MTHGRKALDALEPYVPGKSLAGGIKLSSNENPFGPSPAAARAIQRALEGASPDGVAPRTLNRYPDGGMTRLKEKLSRFWNADPGMFLVGNGSDELLVMIAGAVIEPGTNAVTARHTFSQYTFATTIFGGRMKYAAMPDGGFNLEDAATLIDDGTRIVFLCNPNNPTGTFFTHDALRSFLEAVPKEVIVVVDEAYAEFADSPDFPDALDLIGRHENVVRLRTFSKIYGLAGLRVGYATAHPDLIRTVGKLRQPFNVGTLAQEAAAAALGDEEFVAMTRANNDSGRRRITGTLDSMGIVYYPSEANFVCAHFPGSGVEDSAVPGARSVHEGLAARGISVRPLTSFGMPDHLRISVGTPEENEALCAALRDIVDPEDSGKAG